MSDSLHDWDANWTNDLLRLAERSGPIHTPDPDVADSPDAEDAKWEAAGAARDAR